MASLAEELQNEIRRVRDDVLPAYLEIGWSGTFAVTAMRVSLDAATRALAESDAVACLKALEDLRGFHT